MVRFHVMVLLCLFTSSSVQLTEIDNLTHRDHPLKDIRTEVNQLVNGYLREVIGKENAKHSCNERAFLNSLAKRIGTGFISEIEKEIEGDESIDQVFTKRKESIYRDFNFFEAPGLFFINFGSLINVNGFIIGTDKLGHFLGTGFSYYKIIYYHGKNIRHALAHGEKTERTYYGILLNGVYSYADLSANLDGLRFWERVIGFDESNAAKPYVRCHNNQWVQNATFDIADYVNAAWDEGINCNRYRTNKMLRKVSRRISMLEQVKHTPYQCPIAKDACVALISHYQDAASSVLTPACFAK